jgi:hypothetical protein
MFSESRKTTRTPEVRWPLILHRPRGGHARHDGLAWSQAAGMFHARWAGQLGLLAGMDHALCLGPRRRSVWLLSATAASFSCSLADFLCAARDLCVCAGAQRHQETPREAGVPSFHRDFRCLLSARTHHVSPPWFYRKYTVLRSPPIPRVSIVPI